MASIRQLDLWWAVNEEDATAVAAALQAGADPNAPLSPEEYVAFLDAYNTARGVTPIDPITRRFLLGLAPPPHSGWGHFVLFDTESPDVIRALLDAGVNPDALTIYGGSAKLHNLAGQTGTQDDCRGEVAKLLLRAGASPDPLNERGETPLLLGCWRKGNGDVLQSLLDHGANPNVQGLDGNTPLHAAGIWNEGYEPWPLDLFRRDGEAISEEFLDPPGRYWGAAEAVAALVAAGADPNAVNPKTGQTPARYCEEQPSAEPYTLFLEAIFAHGGRLEPKRRGKAAKRR